MSINRLLNPRSVAIVGVSKNPHKVGHLVARNMLNQGFQGKLCFINPKGESVLGCKSFSSLAETGIKFDLVVLCIPAEKAVSYLDLIIENGCTNVVLFAAGFGEVATEKGNDLERDLKQKIKDNGINLLGPNCIGFINTNLSVNATFFQDVAPSGKISIISQSGALGTAFLDYVVANSKIGISHVISLGNKTFINESDCLEYLKDDPRTKVIGMYLEDVKDGDRFLDILNEVTKIKPVIILKSGRTSAGTQAALSHTGSIASDDDVFSSAVCKVGGIRAETYAEFEMLLKLYNFSAIPTNKRILVLSNAGGMGVLLTDELVASGLELVTVDAEVAQSLNKAFEASKKISVHNPIDLLGDASAFDYQKAIELTMKEKEIGGIIVLLTPQANTQIMETAKVLQGIHSKFNFKPLYPIFMGKDSVSQAHDFFEDNGLASFRYSSELPRALCKIIESENTRKINTRLYPDTILDSMLEARALDARAVFAEYDARALFLNQYDSLTLMSYAGLKVALPYLASSENDLYLISKKEGYPLVLKTASTEVTHKTEIKGVITGITLYEELKKSFEKLGSDPCYVQQQCEGHELFVGAKRDNVFGVIVLVGIGGIYAELFKDIAQLVFPFTFSEFISSTESTKLKKLYSSFRNMPSISQRELYEACYKVGSLLSSIKNIKEIDINPLIATKNGLIAVDARVIISK